MNFSSGREGKGLSSDINVTPLIDIVLVLLIIFMVLTPVMLEEIRVSVPRKATEDEPPSIAAPIVVRVDAAGAILLNGEEVGQGALAARVGERLSRDGRKVVFVDVDDDASYGLAVNVMDLCKGAGANTLGIVTAD